MNGNKTTIFIDGPNLYATSKALGFDVDFKRLLEYYGDSLHRAYYYTAIIEGNDEAYTSIRPLVDWLVYNGYTMVTKPAKQWIQADGRPKIKGNMDIEIAVDAMEIAGYIDHAVLFSGDGDFKPLVLALQRRGLRVTVVSSILTQPAMCADELRRAADTFTDLVDIAPYVRRIDKPDDTVRRSKYAR